MSQSPKQRIEQWIFQLLGKDPDAAVVSYSPVTAIAAVTPLAACAAPWFLRSVE